MRSSRESLRRSAPWIAVVLAALAIDLAVRFGLHPDFRFTLWIEGGVFLLAALVLLGLYHREPAQPGWRRGLRVALIGAFALGGLRSLMWAAGQPVYRANLKILIIAVLAWAYWRRRRRRATQVPEYSGEI
jgi:protein-S-isoprenylcysteine O-methyltransferase Ste14